MLNTTKLGKTMSAATRPTTAAAVACAGHPPTAPRPKPARMEYWMLAGGEAFVGQGCYPRQKQVLCAG